MMQKRKPKPAPEAQPEPAAPVKNLSKDAQAIIAQIRAKIKTNPEFTYLDVIDGLKTATTNTKNPMMRAAFQPTIDMLDALRVMYEDMHPAGGEDAFNAGMFTGVSVLAQVGAKLIEKIRDMPGPDDQS